MGTRNLLCRISGLTACLAGLTLSADLPTIKEAQVIVAHTEIKALSAGLGLGAPNGFKLRNSLQDQRGESHSRFTQTYQGVKVWGGEIIVHVSKEGRPLPSTLGQYSDIYLNTVPALPEAEAMAIAKRTFGAKGAYGPTAANPLNSKPKSELVIFPETTNSQTPVVQGSKTLANNAEALKSEVVRYTLAYHVSLFVGNEEDGIKSQDYMINAHTGAVIKTWNSLRTSTPARGRGRSQYSGYVWLDTTYENDHKYTLRDSTRGTLPHPTYFFFSPGGNGNFTFINNAPFPATDGDNIWGDSSQWLFNGALTSANGQTAAVDAHYGMSVTWDFFKNIFGRNGIDDLGTSVMSVAHIAGNSFYANAGWVGGSQFYMMYGDGAPPFGINSLTCLDVAGHELAHGVTEFSADLVYSGESGGLNESTSDIFGTMVEFYARGAAGTGSVIPATGGDWLLANQIMIPTAPPAPADPLRWMYKPSKDGASFDAWNPTIEYSDVHYNSGPMNRCFYFMSQGSSSLPTSEKYSPFYKTGMTGIGNDHAARIWYRTLTTKLLPNANYWSAREGAIASARELYGVNSPEEKAVANAFAAINVGKAWAAIDQFTPERESNDTDLTAQRLNGTVLLDVKGTMKSAIDLDWFSVDVPAGKAINAVLIPNAASDYDLYIYDQLGNLISGSENGRGWVDTASAANGLGTTQTFYILAAYWGGLTGATGTYRLMPTISATPLY